MEKEEFIKNIRLTLNKAVNMDMKEVKSIIKDMSYVSCKASNKAIRMYLLYAEELNIKKQEDKHFNKSAYEKETYGKSFRAVVDDEMKKIMPLANTNNVGTLHQQLVRGDWNRLGKDILSCKANLPNYKIDLPYYIKSDYYRIENKDGYFISISFFSKEGLKKYNFKIGHKIIFKVDNLGGHEKATLRKIINGEYEQGSAQIHITNKGKVELIVSYKFTKTFEENFLNKDKTLGIDLGINKVAVMSVFNSSSNSYDYFSWKTNVIDGGELIAFRQKYYNLRKELSVASKYSGKGRCGHGYKTKMKNVNTVRNKVANFAETYNHKISDYIVKFAIKHKCGKIQMEDLTGVTSPARELFLKQWSYYDLQQKIEYKAKENNIEVIKVNPAYTSKRCNKCGCILDENRDCKNNQEKFKCVECGHKDDADVNASKNIAIPNIDEIIKDYLLKVDLPT